MERLEAGAGDTVEEEALRGVAVGAVIYDRV